MAKVKLTKLIHQLKIKDTPLDKRYKLTIEEKSSIKVLYKTNKYSKTQLAKIFNVTLPTISRALLTKKELISRRHYVRKAVKNWYYKNIEHTHEQKNAECRRRYARKKAYVLANLIREG